MLLMVLEWLLETAGKIYGWIFMPDVMEKNRIERIQAEKKEEEECKKKSNHFYKLIPALKASLQSQPSKPVVLKPNHYHPVLFWPV